VDIILNMKEQMEELQKQIDQLFEFIQNELSKVRESDARKAIVGIPKRKVMRVEDIISARKSGS